VVRLLGARATLSSLTIGALGVAPIASAFITVEIAAAIVTRWHALRLPAGRATLERRVEVLAVVLACCQAFGVAMYLEALALEGPAFNLEPGWPSRLCIMASFGAFTALVLVAVRLNRRWGLGSGLSFWMAADLVRSVAVALPLDRGSVEFIVRVAIGACVIVALTVVALQTAVRAGRTAVSGLACGLVPITMGASVATLIEMAVPAVVPVTAQLGAGLAVLLVVPLAMLFHPIEATASATGTNASELAAARRAATVLSVVFMLGFLVIPTLVVTDRSSSGGGPMQGLVNVPLWGLLAAIGMDLAGEWRGWAARSDWQRVTSEHRVAVARAVAANLEDEGVPVLIKGLHARCCTYFFGPMYPIEICVPAAELERAEALVRRGAAVPAVAASVEAEPASVGAG
jgi:hypothetical protein